MQRRDQDLLEAVTERHRRENAAPRLRTEIERLKSLRLSFEDIRAEGRTLARSYAKPIVVATAPAYFEICCMEPRCDGRHDLTQPVLRALQQSEVFFAGQSSCDGMIGNMACDHTLAYACEATYST